MSALIKNIPPEVSTQNAEKAREEFVDTGKFTISAPRTVISKSWQKSYELGIDPEATRAPTLMTADEVEEQIQVDDVAKAAVPNLEKITDSLHNSHHVVVLADAKGRIIYSGGHEQMLGQLEEINFRPGAAWNENEVGPNGVGTPLNLGRPELVLGAEHYCRGWQPFVCYGAPIKDPFSKKIIGVVDITGLSTSIRQETMIAAISVADSIQSQLTQQYLIKREELRAISRAQLSLSKDALLLFDAQGGLVDFNQHALETFNINPLYAAQVSIFESYPQFVEAFNRCLKNNSQQEIRTGVFNADENARIVLEPIKHSTHNLGVLVRILSATKTLEPPKELDGKVDTDMPVPTTMLNLLNKSNNNFDLKKLNDEVIQYAIEQCKGNISRAASMLGINRTTIYRHLKSK